MFARALNRLVGYERLRFRGDRFFLSGDFESAHREYRKARSLLRAADPRSLAIDALIRDCEAQANTLRMSPVGPVEDSRMSAPQATSAIPAVTDENDERDGFHPGLEDLFELAIAEKPSVRLERYRALGKDFKAGYVALIQGNAERAVRLLGRAVEENASFVARLELGRAHSLRGDMEMAREVLESAIRAAPHDVEVVILLSSVAIELGHFEEARQRLEALDRSGVDNPEVTFLLGRALFELKRTDAALEKFRQTVSKEPHFHEAFFEGARALRREGDSEGALQLMNRACDLAPDEVRYNRGLAQLVLADGHDEQAGLAACDRLMVTDEDNAWEYLRWVAELYVRRGWAKEARDPLQKALDLVPADRTDERVAIERRLAELDADRLR